jgi:hypothetical protein
VFRSSRIKKLARTRRLRVRAGPQPNRVKKYPVEIANNDSFAGKIAQTTSRAAAHLLTWAAELAAGRNIRFAHSDK